MQLLDRIEKRRFVGREFLLWLWFESDIFEGTLSTKEHGSFGLWVERQIVLTAGKAEATRIKGAQPASTREAKEALRRGKLPESAGLHLSWRDEDSSFTLKADELAVAGLRLPTVLGAKDDETPAAVVAPPRRAPRKPPREGDRARDAERASDAEHEAFYERMRLTREFEELLEALYRDFLALRLSDAWDSACVPMMRAWAAGEDGLDAEDYREARDAAIGAGGKVARSAKRRA